ncbi:MAG: GlsB/YeaQ/YmgE family stress response membrane protein [Thermoleophilaceae bacterium]
MDVLLYLILLVLSGLIVGGLGRLALPGPDPMGLGTTILIGLAGSFLAGLVTWLIFGRGYGGIILSVAFATGIVYAIRRSRGGTLTDPGPGARRR